MKVSIEDLVIIKGAISIHFMKKLRHFHIFYGLFNFRLFDFSQLAKDEHIRKIIREIEHLTDDCNKLQQILEVVISLR